VTEKKKLTNLYCKKNGNIQQNTKEKAQYSASGKKPRGKQEEGVEISLALQNRQESATDQMGN
jgi:hypothetical protein